MKTSLEEVIVSKVITKVIDGVKYTESAVEELTGYKTCTHCEQTKHLNLFTIKRKKSVLSEDHIIVPFVKPAIHTL